MNRLKRQEEAKVAAPSAPEVSAETRLLAEIRDILRKPEMA
jgi:large-conductance mechanosensitive channel